MTGTPAEDGDRAVYVTCTRGQDCPAWREGTGHAHLDRVERADGTVTSPQDAAAPPPQFPNRPRRPR